MRSIITECQPSYTITPDEAFCLGFLHDIGYALINTPEEHTTKGGFLLRLEGYKYWQEVFYHGKVQNDYNSAELRLLNYVNMVTGPTGEYTTIKQCIKDIVSRYGEESIQSTEAIKLAEQIHGSTIDV